MEVSDANVTSKGPALERTRGGLLKQCNQSWVDQLHSTGNQAGVCFWNRNPLVCVHTNAVQRLICGSALGDFCQRAVACLASCSEHNVRALVKALTSRCTTPFGVSKGFVNATGIVRGNNLDI